VIAVDTNLLVYAHRGEMPFHAQAARCLRGLAESPSAWAIPWPCLHEFFGVVTNPRIYATPSTSAQAIAQVDVWHESPGFIALHESTRHWATVRRLITRGRVRGPMVHDARIAAICIDHDVSEFWSADRDFGRFTDLTVRNPLVG
jgi:toxin-antitoxin system PIN domain toxin